MPNTKQKSQPVARMPTYTSWLQAGHDKWRADRRLVPGGWPDVRYVLLHTFAHALIREFALECGYSASGIAERIYARSGDAPMAGIMLYTAAPDSEGTLGRAGHPRAPGPARRPDRSGAGRCPAVHLRSAVRRS